MNKSFALLLSLIWINGCASIGPHRQWVDSQNHRNAEPSWVENPKVTWETDGKIYVRTGHTIRGDERVNGCFELGRLDSQETVLKEIKNDVRGKLDNSQMSMNENAETILGNSRSSEFEGSLTGLRVNEEYWTRYRIGDTERVDCHVLSEITKSDYDKVKQSVVYKVERADPRIKEAVIAKHVNFFENKSELAKQAALLPVQNTDRTPASE